MGDRRSKKTKAAIKQAFLTLLNHKMFTKITISEISELADIGRGTFYLHYEDIYALFSEIEGEMFTQLDQFYNDSFPYQDHQDVLHFINKLTAYIYQNKTLFLVLTNSEDRLMTSAKFKYFFKDKILQEMLERDRAKSNRTLFGETESLFIASGVQGVIEDWIIRGMKENPTDMSIAIQKLLLKLEE
ncbi:MULTISPECIES: TetR/AcrR family transcriptional regulator [Paenibacillus]|uniref:TetR/AcrR family transcriptional regulator n=1 Tax=Paenibacillus TaxID=44249 RepID=UPI000FE1EA21|nr:MULTISPECIES: TetR-like C-terminal domain-containing protein [Paenibacillus]MCM3171919.1 TetR family transcriptional regulator C-terminal domain-containing protein [Paenibacillus sp. MER 99-2]